MVRSNRSLVRDQEHYCRTDKILRLPGCSDNMVCSSPQSNRPSSMVQSRYRRKCTHHSDLDARHATVNQHQLACVSIMPRLFQKTAVVVRHVRTLLGIQNLACKMIGVDKYTASRVIHRVTDASLGVHANTSTSGQTESQLHANRWLSQRHTLQ